ncbi:MAG: hypothetical protein WC355_02865 [Candidatus Omnitrophota bacterium]|jgi:hypothetical protein
MSAKIRKVLSLALAISLLFQQMGFAQLAAELNIASHLSMAAGNLTVEKFRPACLRYFSYDNSNDRFKLLLDKGDLARGQSPSGKATEERFQAEGRMLLDYFLVGITLPDSAFWVNLRPDSEGQIIDLYLEKTDVGKIMLEADLQLKKDTAAMTSPATAQGKEYWDRLYKKAAELYGYDNVSIPTLTRPWIVPGEIIVRESKGSAYVYKANLKVMLEQDYLRGVSGKGPELAQYEFKDERAKALNEYSSQLIRELIIPKLAKEVNSSKRYAALRQVYYSLILSRWFKLRFKGLSSKGTVPGFISRINTGDLTNLTSKDSWTKTDYFKQYQKSFAEGEYNIQQPVYTPTGQVIRSYFSGGIQMASSAINPDRFTNKAVPAGLINAGFLMQGGPKGIAVPVAASPVADAEQQLLEFLEGDPSKPIGFLAKGVKDIVNAIRSSKIEDTYRILVQFQNQLSGYAANIEEVGKEGEEWDENTEKYEQRALARDLYYRILPDIKEALANKLSKAKPQSASSPVTVEEVIALGESITEEDEGFGASSAISIVNKRIKELEDSIAERYKRIDQILEDMANNDKSIQNLRANPHYLSIPGSQGLNDLRDLKIQNENNYAAILRIREHISERERELSSLKKRTEKSSSAVEVLANINGLETKEIVVPDAAANGQAKIAVYDIHGEERLDKGAILVLDSQGWSLRVQEFTISGERNGVITGTYSFQDETALTFEYRIKDGKIILKSYMGSYRVTLEPLKASSAVEATPPENTGGIDFRALPMIIQPMGNFKGLNFQLPQLSRAELEKVDVALGIQQIKKMVQGGILPSGERVKELVAACVQKGEINAYADNLLLSLVDILKLEEENACESQPELREALVIVDSIS